MINSCFSTFFFQKRKKKRYCWVVWSTKWNEVTKEFELVHNVASVEELKEALIKGGKIVICGTPEEVAKCKKSYTGQYLKKIL